MRAARARYLRECRLTLDRAIVPLNDSALAAESSLPAFYCVHSASGVAGTDFLDLAKRLDSNVRFYGIQAPPKQISDVEFGNRRWSRLRTTIARRCSSFSRPDVFCSECYCVGAVIALAMAENCAARGREVGPLMAIDGVPENTGVAMQRWSARYAIDLLHATRAAG